MRPSRWVAALAFLALVPGSIAAAYAGYTRGLYAYWAVPIAFGAVVAVASALLLLLLPWLRRVERGR